MGPARFHCATLLEFTQLMRAEVQTEEGFPTGDDFEAAKRVVRSGIRTHAHRSGLRPERSALDLSAILTFNA